MSRNSFRQIEAKINEYEDMCAHARMERNADLYSRAGRMHCVSDIKERFGVEQ